MESSKHETTSRQSSILKPPKQRQPLQCVVTNPSSAEDSPTIKIKRRVSFAKNRRIREFCNESEQGTVWDDTYEEHDLSNTKNNSNNSTDNPMIINVPCDDKENFPVQLFLKNNQVDCKEVQASVPREERDDLLQCDMEMDNSINNHESPVIGLQNGETEYPNATIYCDDGMDITTSVPSNIIPCHNRDIDNFNDTVPVSHTHIQDTSMVLTENLPLYKKSVQGQSNKNKLDVNSASNSTDLTQAISTILRVGHSYKPYSNYNSKTYDDRLNYSDSMPMEFTSVLPSSTWIRPNNQCQNGENTENFTSKTMEFTMAVPYTNIYNNPNMNKTSGLLEKTKISVNNSMEMTEVVPTSSTIHPFSTNAEKKLHEATQENSKIFFNKSMEMTEMVPISNRDHYSCITTEKVSKETEDKTKLFPNTSTEITETVPIQNKIYQSAARNKIILPEAMQEKTEIFLNKSMEMTEAVPVHRNLHQPVQETEKISHEIAEDKIKLFVNKSIEITETVPVCIKPYESGDNAEKILNEVTQDVTKMFSNKSMEITEAIHTDNRNNQFHFNTEKLPHEEMAEKTKIFSNRTMEITEVVPIHNEIQKVVETEKIIQQKKTNIFSNKSTEITEIVAIYNRIQKFGASTEATSQEANQEKTKIFNKSMEITETVPISKAIYQSNNHAGKTLQDQTQDKTKCFANKSMEMTETIPIYNTMQQFGANAERATQESKIEKTKIFNKSMEITETVPISKAICQSNNQTGKTLQDQTQDKTKCFANKSMEMTETIPIYNIMHQFGANAERATQESNVEKTEIFNKSMEMTEVVPISKAIYQSNNQARKTLHNQTQDKTKCFANKSMEMTETVPIYNIIQQFGANAERTIQETNVEKTKIFNKSMEITEAVPISKAIYQSNNQARETSYDQTQDKTKCFANKPMDMTEIIQIKGTDQSGTGADIVPHGVAQNKMNSFAKSMEITEGISVFNNVPQSNVAIEKASHKLMQEKTNIAPNYSEKMLETIPVYKTVYQSNVNTNKIRRKSTERRPKTIYDKSIEINNSIPVSRINQPCTNTKTILQDISQERMPFICNTSMERTETLPLYKQIYQFPNQGKEIPDEVIEERLKFVPTKQLSSYHSVGRKTVPYELTEEKTKLFLNNSMDVSETIPIPQKIAEINTCKILNPVTNEKTKIVYNTSVDVTEVIPMHQRISASNESSDRNLNEEKTEYFLNKSMDVTEAIPGQQSIFSNMAIQKGPNYLEKTDKEQNVSIFSKISAKDSENTADSDDKTKFFYNKSVEITEPVNQNVFSDIESDKLSKKVAEDKTKCFLGKSMDITETVPIHQQIPAVNVNDKKLPNETAQEKTKIFLDKSMDMTETIAAYKHNFQSNEATQLFHNESMDFTSRLPTLPAFTETVFYGNNQCPKNNYENLENRQSNVRPTQIYHDVSMKMTSGLPMRKDFATQFPNDYGNKRTDNVHRIVPSDFNSSCNRSRSSQNVMDISSKSGSLKKTEISNTHSNYHQPLYDSNKIDSVMEFTAIPSILSSTTRNKSNKLNQYNNQIISSNKVDAISNNFERENDYDISDKLSAREENFNRMTSDELNTLCASMNLPTQKYTREESMTIHNNYIPSCNDVNVLRDSLKNMLSQEQESAIKSNILTERDRSLHSSARVDKTFDKESNSRTFSDMNTIELSPVRLRREEDSNNITMNFSGIHRSSEDKSQMNENNFNTSTTTNLLYGSMCNPEIAVETDKTAEINFRPQLHQQSSSSAVETLHEAFPDVNRISRHLNDPADQNSAISGFTPNVYTSIKVFENTNKESNQISNVAVTKDQSYNRLPTGDIINVHTDVSFSTAQKCPTSETVTMHKTVNVLDQNTQSSEKNKPILTSCGYAEHEKSSNNKIHIYHDISMEFASAPSTSTAKRKSEEPSNTLNKNSALNVVKSVHTSMEISETSKENKNNAILSENILNRIPPNNTDLLATIDFKTQLSHPLVINDKTFINVSCKSLANKTYTVNTDLNVKSRIESNKMYGVDKNRNVENQIESSCLIDQAQNEIANVIQNVKIPVLRNEIETNEVEEECESSDKENKEPDVRVNLFPEKYLEELEEIEPPSFLCSDSIQDDLLELPNSSHSNSLSNNVNERISNVLPCQTDDNVRIIQPDCNKELSEELEQCPSRHANSSIEKVETTNNEVLSSTSGNIKQIDKPDVYKSKEVKDELLTPFLLLTKNIKMNEESNDFIWTVRIISPKVIAIDFITKSFVVIVRLNEIEKACIRDIEKIEIVSLLHANSKNILLRIVHDLLLSKLNPGAMLEKYKMYEDILPLLEYVSSEVIFTMNFMFDLERLSALNLLNIDKKRILFKVASRKANIILEVSLEIKVFNEIGPDDINVTCILGDIRKKDIKQLIVNIKRDSKFLSRYINDVKDYITLMEDSTCLSKK